MTIIGHERTREALEAELPPATLLSGPASIGKRTLVRHLAVHHRVGPYDQSTTPAPLTVDTVRRLRSFVHTAPFGAFRLVMIHLDEASVQAQNALLKILEEPPATVKFLLTASRSPLSTIMSRCQRERLSFLTQDQVEQVLHTVIGLPQARAAKAAQVAGGQIKPALKADSNTGEQRTNVVEAMKAIAVGDLDGFHRAFITWDTEAATLLTIWFTEAITQRWTTFSAEETFGMNRDRDRLMHMITALTRVGSANPRLQARAALEPFVGR